MGISKKVEQNCKNCDKVFSSYLSEKQKFCSLSCSTNYRKNRKRPPFSKEWIDNMSKSKKGKPNKSKTKFIKGQISWNKGKKNTFKHTNEAKEKIRKANIGRKHGYSLSGERHWNWKGGISLQLKFIRRSNVYKKWRDLIFIRDNFTCILCGARCGNGKKIVLNADHYPKTFSSIIQDNAIKTYEQALECKELWDTNNARTLCYDCHIIETRNYQKLNWINQYGKK